MKKLGAVLLCLVFLVAGAHSAEAKTRRDRVIEDSRITESSGLAPSLLHKNVLWTHNDSGGANEIYAIAENGSTAATLTIAGEPARDWEAITSLRGPQNGPSAGQALIAVADIGDNQSVHPSVRIAIVEEPQKLSDSTAEPIRVLELTYPGGPRDAEAVLADPRSGQLYVVSKTLFGSELFAVPKKVWPGKGATGVSKTTQMTRVAGLSPSLITDGAFLPDGNLALRGYGNLAVVADPTTVENERLETLASVALPDQEQGESLAVSANGKFVLIGSEGSNSPILRVRVPTYATQEEPPATSSAPPQPSSSDQTAERIANLTGEDTRLRLVIGAGAAVFVLVALFGAVIMLRPNRSRRRRR